MTQETGVFDTVEHPGTKPGTEKVEERDGGPGVREHRPPTENEVRLHLAQP